MPASPVSPQLIAVNADPATAAPSAPVGSVALRTDTGAIYSRSDNGWHALAAPAASLAAIAYSGSASDLVAGTLPATVMPALTGDVTAAAGTVTTSIATAHVVNAMLRNSAAASVIGRSANTVGTPGDIPSSADGQALGRTSGSLAFTAPPVPSTLVVGYKFASISATTPNPNYAIPSDPIVFLHLSTSGVGPIPFSGFTSSTDGQILIVRAEGSAGQLVGNDPSAPSPLLLFGNASSISLAQESAIFIWDATMGNWVQVAGV